MKCDCGHSTDHHNPGDPYEGIQDDFSGNCRNCSCKRFTRGAQLEAVRNTAEGQLKKMGLIARERGEVIVRHWQDEMAELKAEHQNDVAQFQVLLEEGRRLQRISNKKIVELEETIRALRKR